MIYASFLQISVIFYQKERLKKYGEQKNADMRDVELLSLFHRAYYTGLTVSEAGFTLLFSS